MPKDAADIWVAAIELLKALIWPFVILMVVLMFKSHIGRILRRLADRLSDIETIKFDLAGASFATSLVANSLRSDPEIFKGEHRQLVEQSLQALASPLADVIALKLWHGKSHLEQMVSDILEPTKVNGQKFAPVFIYTSTLRAKDILNALEKLRYVEEIDDQYELTEAGRAIFKDVPEHEDEILARFKEDRLSL